MNAITILLADDHVLVRDSLGQWLNSTIDLRVVSVVGTAEDAVRKALSEKPNVVLLDIDMPGQASFSAAEKILERCPGTKVLFLSAFFNDHYIEQALRVQASGYLTKSEPPAAVARAVRMVMDGQVYFSPEVQSRIVLDSNGARLKGRGESRIDTLSERELEVLRYLARAMSKKEIAKVMNLSIKTVDRHTANLMEKLNIHDRVELARFAIREGVSEA